MRSLKVGIVCYPTLGGSGVVATELAVALAERGHQVHMFTYAPPHRETHGVRLHLVDVVVYPLLRYPPYDLALASYIVDTCARDGPFDVLHVHYAVPHAICAFLAREMLGEHAFSTVTTLHGTDISIVGSDPAYATVTRFGIERSDAVTAVSENLRQSTRDVLGVKREIDVIPNFVNADVFRPLAREPRGFFRLCHASNFREVKRPHDLIAVLRLVRQQFDARLSLIGDGPELSACLEHARKLQLDEFIDLLGPIVVPNEALGDSDVFLLPSALESFGLSALEALACGVPVVASNTGGIPEVVEDGSVGFLYPIGDVERMADGVCRILGDPVLRERLSTNARAHAIHKFSRDSVVVQYENLYRRII
jgi:N-acetyl-alpha-D-glucosaminyl L-malate synthase BshA